ncbi:MAG: 1-deoxy-D-xylulose-5-phosphate synthase N-terminal domain-containing protein [Thermoproteus sp. AZ2]|uniref:1-deoxy-D-xylulose-5-phosphate synthase N-terminal domain-containing protein n=1 Tax=Thermoproteus sp. AZ2 TaxID=1609232 RepID=A0ACC6V040_9CREN
MEQLSKIACEARRRLLLMAAYDPGIHIGSSLSVLDILTVIYGSGRAKFNAHNGVSTRNYLVLSKGHAVHAIYALASVFGHLNLDELRETGSLGSRLQNHPEDDTPFTDVSNSGSLGLGIGMAIGLALGLRLRGAQGRVYLITGDGELDEGLSWESFAVAASYRLSNLIAIVDLNGAQLDGPSEEVLRKGDIAGRFKALGFYVQTIDGHDYAQAAEALERAEASGAPSVIVANTVRGKGVPELEGSIRQRIPRDEALALASRLKCQ